MPSMMSKPLRRFLPDLVLTVLVLGGLALLFGDLLFHPNRYLFSSGGDGLKNYFTAVWAVRYDRGWWFSGMNYPFGEHLTYTDAQPLLVWFLRALQDLGLPVDGRVPGIMNLLMMLSLLPAAWFTRRIGKHYGLPEWLAIWTALVVVFLSPQILRWQGHYALGYACFVPMVWWMILVMRKATGAGSFDPKQAAARSLTSWLWMLAIMAVITGFGFLHLYYLLIGMMMLGAYAVVLAVTRPREIATSVRAVCAGVGAFVLIYLFLDLTDGVSDRTTAPFGFLFYRASPETVFYSASSPFLHVLKPWIHFPAEEAEGLGYVGLPGLLLAIFAIPVLAFLLIRSLRHRQVPFGFTRATRFGDLWIWAIAGLGILMVAMALPFRWGLEHWLDYVAPLKQFRSPGRLVFVFYHIWTMLAAVVLYRLFRLLSRRGPGLAGWVVIVLLMGCWTVEAVRHSQSIRRNMNQPNVFLEGRFTRNLLEVGVAPDDFQAFLTLPFYHMGSEKLYVEKGTGSLAWGMQAACETGIPLLNVMMSRTSVSQTLSTTSLVSRYGPEPGFVDMLDQRPVLLLINGPRRDIRLSVREQALLNLADSIYSGPDYSLWSLRPALFNRDIEPLTDPADGRKGVLLYDGFEQGQEPGLFGKAEFHQDGPWVLGTASVKPEWAVVATGKARPDTVVEISLWTKAYLQCSSFPDILLEWLDNQDRVLWSGYIITKQSTDVQPGWVQASRKLEPMPGGVKLRITAQGQCIGVDGLLVQAVPAE